MNNNTNFTQFKFNEKQDEHVKIQLPLVNVSNNKDLNKLWDQFYEGILLNQTEGIIKKNYLTNELEYSYEKKRGIYIINL